MCGWATWETVYFFCRVYFELFQQFCLSVSLRLLYCHLKIEVRIKTESILISKFSMPEVFLHSPHVCLLHNCTIKLFSFQAHILYYSSYQWNFCQALWNQIRGRAQKKSVILTIKIAFAMDDVKNLKRSSSWVSTKSFSGYSFEE